MFTTSITHNNQKFAEQVTENETRLFYGLEDITPVIVVHRPREVFGRILPAEIQFDRFSSANSQHTRRFAAMLDYAINCMDGYNSMLV